MADSAAAASLASIGVLLDDAGRALLVFARDDQVWMPPGGRIESGESPQDAVVRELREELGLEAEAGPLVAVYTLRLDGDTHYRFVFRCRAQGEPRITAPDEVEKLAWFARDALPEPLSRSAPFAVMDAASGRLGLTRLIG
ncbi:MAG: NUDIX hydrolase [Actinomycetota bacterium]|nr:NUDIX hydrolase [Actinomycetota bacterium]